MSWKFLYDVRPADPMDRRDHPDAHEVVASNEDGGNLLRVVGVWTTQRAAIAAAASLNLLAKEQIR